MCNAYCKTNAWIRLCSWRAGSISWQVCQTASTSVWILSSGRKQILNTNRSSTKRAADAGRTGHIFRDLRVSFALQRDSLNKVNTIFCNEGASCCIYLYKVCRLTFLIEKKPWQRVQMRCTRKWSCSIQAFKRENMAKGKTAARTLTMLSTIALTRWCQDPGECGQRQFRKLKAALKKTSQLQCNMRWVPLLHLCTSQRQHHAIVRKRKMTLMATWQADVWNCNMIAWFIDSLCAIFGSLPAPQFEAWRAFHFASPSYKGQVTETALGQMEINQLKWPCHRRSAQTLP